MRKSRYKFVMFNRHSSQGPHSSNIDDHRAAAENGRSELILADAAVCVNDRKTQKDGLSNIVSVAAINLNTLYRYYDR